MAGPRHALSWSFLTLISKGQRTRLQGYQVQTVHVKLLFNYRPFLVFMDEKCASACRYDCTLFSCMLLCVQWLAVYVYIVKVAQGRY